MTTTTTLHHLPAAASTMTEYDYSPEAYDRYKAKLRSIDRWVHETERHEPANPFMPTPGMPTARLPGSSDVSYTSGGGGGGSRHTPQRSYTAPASRGSSSGSGAYGSSTNVYQHTPPQRYPQDYRYPYPPSPPAPMVRPPHRSNTLHAPPQPPQPPQRSNTSPQIQVYDPRVGVATRVIVRRFICHDMCTMFDFLPVPTLLSTTITFGLEGLAGQTL